jgi:hypothetical protein
MTFLITFFQDLPAWDIPILTFFFGVLSTLCFLFIKRYLAASDDFRSAVHTNLVGIYPTIEYISIEQ